MDVRILDLDGGVARQHRLASRAGEVHEMTTWGPRLRLACGWKAFRRFEDDLAWELHAPTDRRPAMTFVGSGDFHHLSLALVRRIERPINLLVIDNHPDWMRGVPLLHCGTWVYHAARLPWVQRIFHVGGDVDFDNHYRWTAPWPMLRSGKIVVIPARRKFQGRGWDSVRHEPLRECADQVADMDRIMDLLGPYRLDLARFPLYVSLDRDVMQAEHAVVNWDSGHLVSDEVHAVLDAFREASPAIAGMDVVGDWSPVKVQGLGRKILHWMEHPTLDINEVTAQRCNEALNLALVKQMTAISRPRISLVA